MKGKSPPPLFQRGEKKIDAVAQNQAYRISGPWEIIAP